MVMDSAEWQCVEAVPAIAFSIAGQTAVRARDPRGSWMTVAEGFVEGAGARRLTLEDDVTLTHSLPPGIDLGPLVGSHVRLMLRDEHTPGGQRAQTLTIAGTDRRTRLVACFGPVPGQSHTIGSMRVRAALSQRPGGPLVFGTDQLQYVLQVGDGVRILDGRREYIMRFVERTAYDYAAYVIAEQRLWRAVSHQRSGVSPREAGTDSWA
jgi:hypothetical protein